MNRYLHVYLYLHLYSYSLALGPHNGPRAGMAENIIWGL